MRILLDTHVLLWMDAEPDKLSPAVKAAIMNPDNEIIVSAVSVWEIIIKQAIGKLTTRQPLRVVIEEQRRDNGIQVLPVSLKHVWVVESLPAGHKDPFDRLLIAQAIADDLTIATADAAFATYPVQILW